MTEQTLLRSATKMDPNDFKDLFRLNNDCPWVQPEMESLTELWNMCETQGQRQMIMSLIRKFEVIDSRKLIECGKATANHIEQIWSVTPAYSKIVAVTDSQYADGAQVFLQSIRNKFSAPNRWSERNFLNKISEGVNAAQNNCTIILLDDFIGTGKTIERRLTWFRDKLKKCKKNSVDIKVVALAGMEEAKTVLDTLEVDYFCPVWLKKGISDHPSKTEISAFTQSMAELEDMLGDKFRKLKLRDHNFGYGRSEALYYWESFNVPNNVFPLFWWPVLKDSGPRRTILHRSR